MMSNLRYKWGPPSPSSSEDCCHVLPAACGTWWNVAPGPSSAVLRSPVRYTPMPLQLSLGFFLRSRGWATPRLAGLWGAAQQSLKKKSRRVMIVTYLYVIGQASDQHSDQNQKQL